MSWLSILTLAVGLAMDATAVSAARGLAISRVTARHVALVMLFFGGAQALMPLVGWAVGARLGSTVSAWDHWIAFVLLGAIGGKMLWEARAGEADEAPPSDHRSGEPFSLALLFTLSIATSIDALAVGVTLPLLGAPLAATVATVGVTTAVLSALGLFAGRKFGSMLGKRLDAVGGLVLIGLGTKILVEHLGA